MRQRRQVRAAMCVGLLCVSSAATSFAQTQQPATTTWELEGYGGFHSARRSGSGTVTLPDAGAPLTSTSPVFPARRTPSWFFGDCALMLNQALDELGVSARVSPFDAALSSLGGASTSGASFGVRLRRRVAPRVRAELSLDVLAGSAAIPEELADAAASSSATFETAMAGLFASGPFTGTDVTSRTIRSSGSSRELVLTGALNVDLGSGALAPYVTVGGGLIAGASDGQSLTLEGRYQTTIAADGAGVAIDETDRLTLRSGHGRTYVVLAGAGLRRDFSGSWGMRLDGRVLIGGDNTRLRIDAAPSVTRGTPAGFIETLTHPNLHFSNDPATGRESSLSDRLDGFEAFAGSGISTRVLITVGLVRRF